MPSKIIVDLRARAKGSTVGHIVIGHHPDLTYIGVVRSGMQIGALGRSPDGRYWQVNGDVRRLLNPSQTDKAIEMARRAQNQHGRFGERGGHEDIGGHGGMAPEPGLMHARAWTPGLTELEGAQQAADGATSRSPQAAAPTVVVKRRRAITPTPAMA